jgi:hypothetical protein
MLDLRKYNQLPADWTWVERETERLTEKGLLAMQNAIYNTLMKVPEGQYFDIERSVKPENHEVFVRTVCEFLDIYRDYRFNLLMNRVHHDRPIQLPLKKTPHEAAKE